MFKIKHTNKLWLIATIITLICFGVTFTLVSCDDGTTPCSHTWTDGEIITAATCFETGLQEQICSNCKEKGTPKTIAQRNHIWDDEDGINTPANCTDKGGTKKTCTHDDCSGYEIIGEEEPALGHDESGDAATCTTPKVCKRNGCEHILATDPDNHDESGAAADCTNPKVCNVQAATKYWNKRLDTRELEQFSQPVQHPATPDREFALNVFKM